LKFLFSLSACLWQNPPVVRVLDFGLGYPEPSIDLEPQIWVEACVT
jgi:hypothetical protein